MLELFSFLEAKGFRVEWVGTRKDLLEVLFRGYWVSIDLQDDGSYWGAADGSPPFNLGPNPQRVLQSLGKNFPVPKEDEWPRGMPLQELEALLERFDTGYIQTHLLQGSALSSVGTWKFRVRDHKVLDETGKPYDLVEGGPVSASSSGLGHCIELRTPDDWMPPRRVIVTYLVAEGPVWVWKRGIWRHLRSPVWASDPTPEGKVNVYRPEETVRPVNTLTLSPGEGVEGALALLDAWTRWSRPPH